MAKKKKADKAGHFVPEEYRAAYEQFKKESLQADFEALVGKGPWVPFGEAVRRAEEIHRQAQRKKRKRA